ncbi:uncharacterized protein SCHCODRAFT_02623838 [Schizophyllum commune H4-8]|uniref:uncharacterized protein n=1 Tax=Schizophyllum commune (strain H4-8 / FGSC 9210) TaxID=578458 RepID=UPI00215EBC25|nr:uncharacterized protein SCHCODRAFT_02623838 [Schizophyllum commune H4-8]KAI5894140.1 hypothetical protein SCHCODRAFT_02623838 [Schizophyllum commune H4-8]
MFLRLTRIGGGRCILSDYERVITVMTRGRRVIVHGCSVRVEKASINIRPEGGDLWKGGR